jgi:hypothetical protein
LPVWVFQAVVAATAAEIADAVVARQEDRENSRQDATVAISRASQAKVSTLFNRVGLVRTLNIDPVPVVDAISFSRFDWRGRDENAGLPDARDHIEAQLGKFGVRIGRGGYKIKDVHKEKTLLDVDDPKVAHISGGTDVAMVPFKTADAGIPQECSVLFELKTSEKVQRSANGFKQFEPQAVLELLAARCLSHQPGVLVVLTDLVSGAVLYSIEYAEEHASFCVVEKETTLDEMGVLVAEFLADKAVPNESFRPNEAANNPRDTACIAFKRAKLSHDVGLAWEHFEEMAEDAEPNSRERAQLVDQLFRAMDAPYMSSLVHHCMYS